MAVAAKAAQGKAPLGKLYGHLKTGSSKIKRLAVLDPRLKEKRADEKLLRIGVVRPLAVALDPIRDSSFYRVEEGDVRVAAVVSPAALFTRVHFKGMSLPAGARVFVYAKGNPDKYFGPYEGHGESPDGTFWTPPLPGDTVVIEYISPAGTVSTDAPFKVYEVSHIYKDLFQPNDPAGSCNLEVPDLWDPIAKAVAMLTVVKSGQTSNVATLPIVP